MRRNSLILTLFLMICCMPSFINAGNSAGLTKKTGSAKLNPTVLSGLKFRNIGPALTSGRISDIAIHPTNRYIWYVAVGSGGVWKTENGGTTWQPIFDNETSYSIGCVTIDPNFPDTIWVGTGENVSGRHVGFGDGIYKSLNGGKTWQNMGLKTSEHISKILVDPRNSDVVYAACEGNLWAPGGERGVYKTPDGGKTWTPCLTISKDTGVTDIAFEPGNPDIIYAAAYQRRRSVAAFMGGGPESGIYKTTNEGNDWRKLSVGLPQAHMGRIGLAVSPIEPNVVYATIEAIGNEKGFYRSEDRGESWQQRNSYISGGTGPHYYQEIFADPHRFDRVYQMDVWMQVTDDGGNSFHRVGENSKHSDNHALAFIAGDPDFLLAGCDGGLYESHDCGRNWHYFPNLPITQFYKIALDNATPFYNIHGGTQDNGSQLGPSRTMNINGIMNRDWIMTDGADGYACAIDPENPDTIYVSWQTGGIQRYNKRSGEKLDIQPKPAPGEDPPRWNWDSPILISPHCHTRLYYGSQRLYRSDDRGDSWTPISGDLTRGISRLEQPLMGRTWSADALWDHSAMSYFGTLTSITESPLQEGLLYVGTDDGRIAVSEDSGSHWRTIERIPGVPTYFFVNDMTASLHNKNTVFAALDNHKTGDLKPYLVKSTDRGHTWSSIRGDLPHGHITWAIEQDHVNPKLLFIGTEFGIFFTIDGGNHWHKLAGGVPVIPFRDIKIQRRENDLVGASFGRGIFILDDYSPLRHLDSSTLEQESYLFPVKKAPMYHEQRPFSLKAKAFQGDDFYTAPNPPFGAIFTYYLKDGLQTGKQQRRRQEKQLEKQGKTIPFPGWNVLNTEAFEESPAIILTIKDTTGSVVRRLKGKTSPGIHRLAWDLRYAPLQPTKLSQPYLLEPWFDAAQGPLVVPGTFTVEIAKLVDGKLTQLVKPQQFEVEFIGMQEFSASGRQKVLNFQRKAAELQRALMGTQRAIAEALKQTAHMKEALLATPHADLTLREDIRQLERQLIDFQQEILGNRKKQELYEPYSPGLFDRIEREMFALGMTTRTQERDYDIAAKRFAELSGKLKKLLGVELENLKKKLEAAGAPWTPGRGIPNWKKNKNKGHDL